MWFLEVWIAKNNKNKKIHVDVGKEIKWEKKNRGAWHGKVKKKKKEKRSGKGHSITCWTIGSG